MTINFRGVAHPPPNKRGRSCKADLTPAEIGAMNLGRRGGTDLLVEHDHGERVGRVLSSWEGKDGSLRVSGVVTDAAAANSVKSGTMRGLSLGTSVITGEKGERLACFQDELSLCEAPRRAGCWITDVDGRQVRQLVTASAKGAKHSQMKLANDKCL
jgi:hypothetical protein